MKTNTSKDLVHRRVPSTAYGIFGVAVLLLFTGVLAFGVKKPVVLSYAEETCASQVTIAPSLMQQADQSGYGVVFKDTLQLGGVNLVSLRTCFEPLSAPEVGQTTVAFSPWAVGILAKQFQLTIPEPPQANMTDIINNTIPTTRPVKVPLSGVDRVFGYTFALGEQEVECASAENALSCDITTLKLDQGATYSATLSRQFGAESTLVASGEVDTLLPLTLKKATLQKDQVRYDVPKQFEFEFDAQLFDDDVTLEQIEDDDRQSVALSTRYDKETLIIELEQELPREATFRLTIASVEAVDGSALAEPIILPFSTSGGPKVTAVSSGAISAPVAGSITFTFDQEVADPAEALKLVSVAGVDAAVAFSQNKMTITYSAGLCTPLKVTIKEGLESDAGIKQDEDYSFSTRTRCYSTSVIGYSEQGRAIVAYSFGSGVKKVLFQGAMHGNEGNTKALLDTWIGVLEASPGQIPSGTQVVVIPLVNPDGYAAGTRNNARNVDLNRNFDTTDWQSDVETVNGQPLEGGGGSSPESESEAKALADYTRQLSPSLTLSYHSVASYVIANTCGNSSSLAATYASLSGYSNKTGVSGAFSYEITGTYDDWMCQRLGLRSILVELATSYSAEFERNKAAMWEMVRS